MIVVEIVIYNLPQSVLLNDNAKYECNVSFVYCYVSNFNQFA